MALEIKSSHPVASALVSHYSGCITDKIAIAGANVGLPDVTDFKSVPGQGLKGIVCDHSVVVGNMKMLRQFSVHVPIEAERLFASWSDRGETVIFCSIDQQVTLVNTCYNLRFIPVILCRQYICFMNVMIMPK